MRRRLSSALELATTIAGLTMVSAAAAQDVGGGAKPSETPAPPEGKTTVVKSVETQTSSVYIPPYGTPERDFDPNANLPSSSRPITNTAGSSDGFDLAPPATEGAVVRGRANGSAILKSSPSGRPMTVPEIHTVRRGDTLWGLCQEYYDNPWSWPKLWSQNPQIQNPHWIYPGDQLRLRADGRGGAGIDRGGLGDRGFGALRAFRSGNELSSLRNIGYVDDPERDKLGEVVGAREDRMFLADEASLYLMFRSGVDIELGQELVVYRKVREADDAPGARKPPGDVIKIQGRVRVDQYNPKTRVARATVLESTDVIERGAFLGPASLQLEPVAQRPSQRDTWARVLRSFYPFVYMGSMQLVMIDRGTEDGLAAGNRLFVVRRGDSWRRTLDVAEDPARETANLEVVGWVEFDRTPLEGEEQDFPEESVAVLQIVRTSRFSSVAYVVEASREIVAGDRAVARKGL